MIIPEQLDLRFRHTTGHSIVETDVVITTRSAWTSDPRSRDHSWSIVEVNGDEPLIVAVQICLPAGSSSWLVDTYRRFDRQYTAKKE
jgi:hypothetical protein